MKSELKKSTIVAYQGIEGAYSHLACKTVFPDYQALACENFQTAIKLVEKGNADFAMIPLENSTAGRVEEIYRLLPKTHLNIIGEHFEPVNHCLLALPGIKLKQIKTVSSHPQALAQCFHRLDNLGITPLVAMDTALSAKELAGKKESASLYGSHGAIASTLAAELYGLDVIAENFQDVVGNTTRFIVLAKNASNESYEPKQYYITSILFSVRNMPAALYKALGGFATNGVNMIKLESYMDGGTMEASHFHIDIAGHHQQNTVKNALEELDFFAKEVRILGSYPAHKYRKKNEFV
jgi:prephenate dehydratase|tara:strand:+ start:874 stop:1758 length:885 start_codon:yes stop_codon:yes gene_type:complete